jgi:RNA 2',3'-cyclic 3'-phosphodiesterase
MEPTQRCFIAMEIPGEVQKSLARVISSANLTAVNGFRPVRSGMIHLTLKFLGDTSFELIPALQRGLSEVVSQAQPFEVQVKGVGAFASWDHPRTIWAGLIVPSELTTMVSSIERMCTLQGFLPEKRPFSPHLTLARVSEHPDREKLEIAIEQLRQYQNTEFGSVLVTGVTLFQSTMGQGGSIYTPISGHKTGITKV